VAEICSNTGVAVQSATDAEQWALALDTLAAEHDAGPLVMSASWAQKYDWDAVGARVNRVLTETAG
jgi:hypothetical protein